MAPSAAAEPSAAPTSSIVPIRVDVLSEDKTLRIVDTLLFDPTCWPVSLYHPLHVAVEENVTQLAHTILSDAEVQGMGRTIRHFTGRLDLWTPKLQTAVEDQLRPQLWRIATKPPEQLAGSCSSSPIPISIRLQIDRMVIHEDILWDSSCRLSPLEFARDMAEELNLPDEATVAIATTIVEQLHGLTIDTTSDPTLANNATNSTNTSNANTVANNTTNNNNVTTNNASGKPSRGAWLIDPKEHASIAQQVVAQHRSI